MDKIDILINAINGKYDEIIYMTKRAPTGEEFDRIAFEARKSLKIPYTDAEFHFAKERVQENRSVNIGIGIYVEKKSPEHELWYGARAREQKNPFNERFMKYLCQAKQWSNEAVAALDRNTSEVMDRIGDPKKEGEWHRKGLLIGDVQSGKTLNYTSVCNKAVDSGYKVIIVLAGLTNNLRKQTQQRLETDFVGRSRRMESRPGEIVPISSIGVGVYGKTDNVDVEVFTSVERDFSKTVADTTSVSFGPNAMPRLFVLKKNKTVLTNLERWLRDVARGGRIDSPLLLIDDESDNASVNTKADEYAPSAINACIRKILKLFSRSSYLGVTATPFANIFINPYIGDENKLDSDLFPEDFIYYLPAPNTYIGSERVFRSDEYADMVIPIGDEEVEDSFKFGHKKSAGIPYLPESLKKALRYFMLTNCVRDVLGQRETHRSMMINVSRYVAVQNLLKEKVCDFWTRITTYARSYAKQGAAALQYPEIREIKAIWDEYGLSRVAKKEWEEIQPSLYESNKNVQVYAINQRSADNLDYDGYLNGNGSHLRVIAVGGNCLSRGMTLEGLCVSYFYRNSKMYDTLMQMGRWFGYRPGYDGLVKVWMASDAIEWYEHISAVTDQLILEIFRMNRNGLTPMDFGFKIQGHPDALIPTALNKMRNAEKDFKYVEVEMAGHLIESPRLPYRDQKLKQNEDIVRKFILNVSKDHQPIKRDDEDLYWKGIKSEDVADLVRSFKSAAWHHYFNSDDLGNYIDKTPEEWDVYIKRGECNEFQLDLAGGPVRFACQRRGNTLIDHNLIRISGTHVRVGWGGCASVTLSKEKKAELDKAFRETGLARKKGKENEYKETPDDFYLYGAEHPILFIHFLYLTKKVKDDNGGGEVPVFDDDRVIVALGLGFPSDEDYETAKTSKKKREKLTYYLNSIATQLKNEEGDDSYDYY